MEKYVIYVSVEEFLRNGGNLIEDRNIYDQDGSYNLFDKIGTFVKNDDTNDEMIIVRKTDRSVAIYKDLAYVKVEVTPIWK